MKRWTSVGAAFVVAMSATVAPAVARAQTEVPADDAAARDAKARFEEGLKRYEAGDFEGARVAFQQAYSVLHAVDILYNLSLSELRSGRPVEALHHLQEYLKDKRPNEEERAKASKFLAEAHSKTGHVFVEAPAGATVLMDDVALDARAPIKDPVDVSAGKHVCTVRLPEKTQTVEVVAQPGQSVTVRFAQGPGEPEVLEGEQRGGRVEKRKGDGGWPAGKVVTVIGLGALAVGGVVAGVVFLSDQSTQSSDAASVRGANPGLSCVDNNPAGACAQLRSDKDAYQRDGVLAPVFFAAGGVLAASAIAADMLWPNKSAEPRQGLRVTPSVGPTGMGMSLSGAF